MLKGLEISVINFSKVKATGDIQRIDSEPFTFKKERISSKYPIERLSNLVTINPSKTEIEQHKFMQASFIPMASISKGYISNEEEVYVTDYIDKGYTYFKEDDLLIATITPCMEHGKCAIVQKMKYQIGFGSTELVVFRVKNINNLLKEYLFSYLNRDTIRKRAAAYFIGTSGRQRVPTYFYKDLEIPLPSISFQNKIKNYHLKSIDFRSQSKILYSKAESLLLHELGLNNFEPTKEAVNIKSFKESFGNTKRLDAEYYQKKYDDLEIKIVSQKHLKIKDIRSANFRGLQPIYFEDGELYIINSKHILETTLDYDNFEKTKIEYWNKQEKARVFRGDILTYTTGANIGRTQVYLKNEKALASNHVNIIRLKTENPFYVGFVLNSVVGRMQTEKRSAGSAQAELYPKDLDEFLIPIIDLKKQKQIAELVEESFKLKAESERLLEVAKKAVEMAIELDEESAIKFINSNK